MRIESTSRVTAALTHLSLSVAIACLLWAALHYVWYPEPLFTAIGGKLIFFILLGVDVVLGPLLTFVVWKTDRKKLIFDLSVIACAQFTALLYGIFTLWEGRPVYVAALGHRFDVVQASDVDPKELEYARVNLPRAGPVWVGVLESNDRKEHARILFAAQHGYDYGHFPRHHAPLASMRDEILKRAKDLGELKRVNPRESSKIDEWLAERNLRPEEVVYQGLRARAEDMAVIMDAKTAKVIGIAPFKPWP